ncbi:MAG: response regulator transcription factor [Acetatifactor sp.]|nr:response regulator transcription factor [Acetatifactor sp.]
MEGNAVNVLFLEDEPTIREVLAEYMKLSGYRVTEIARGDGAIALLQENTYDIAVLDVMVPGADGFEVLQYIRDNCPQTATIMLTALDDEKTQIKAFNLYADDYVIKPVSPIILLKRMETILRRTLYMKEKNRLAQDDDGSAAEWVNEGEKSAAAGKSNAGQERAVTRGRRGLHLEEEAYSAYYGDEKLPLTLSEYLLLQALYNEPRRVHTREQLILHIYNEEYIGNDRIIDAHVKNLRKKLPVNCIKTIIGVGYQFDSNVSTIK